MPREIGATGEAVHLLLDTGHATWGGADPVALAARCRERISHVHAKDVRKPVMAQAGVEGWSLLDAVLGKGKELGVYTVPGDGMVDYPAVFALCRAIRAGSWPSRAPKRRIP
ncbi:Xylose isomerase-like TIM barrel [Bosea sp. OK403]|uniref:TIM barrel protein n=1 Tax=Bosea sp. OK403 TaxID=1855286 RepID=UPI0008E0699D|nr:TIM barrel protein [Bosea sp. OK403]SFJ15880.1 Xylose isomerase-like TIM barrel [Bosea sp. OK403]